MQLFGWEDVLDEVALEKSQQLFDLTTKMRQTTTIYPESQDVFKALEYCSPKNVKVIILGQDPYHGPNQACGMSFSVHKECKIPPSLKNIYKELEDDLQIAPAPTGDLTRWAAQGVLLLNTSLTVEAKKPNSHSKLGWSEVTHTILTCALKQKTPSVHIVLAWGMSAINEADSVYKTLSDEEKDRVFILKSTHPSPFSARNNKTKYPAFIGSKPFSRTNEILVSHGINPINW